jgi:hypothetical protein
MFAKRILTYAKAGTCTETCPRWARYTFRGFDALSAQLLLEAKRRFLATK